MQDKDSKEGNLKEWQHRFEVCLADHPTDDGSHDVGHFRRVWSLAKSFTSGKEDLLVILAACYFHDIVSYPKNHPNRSRSSKDAAIKAAGILKDMSFPEEKIPAVSHCIEAHSYSANIPTESPEAEIVQDADRMEALGAIGLARTFYVSGRMGSKLFCSEDPFARSRELNDKTYAVDHFKTKLLKLPSTMKTAPGKVEATRRANVLENFLRDLDSELNPT